MKARLSIGALVCVVMLALASIGGVTKALADDPGGLTCGGSVYNTTASYQDDATGWFVSDHHNCNDTKTYSWEVQTSSAANPQQWNDYGGDHIKTSGKCATGCFATYSNASIGCPSGAAHVRVKWWWSGGSLATNSGSGSAVCLAGVVLSAP